MSPSTATITQPATRRARTTADLWWRRRGGQISPASMAPGTFGMTANVPWQLSALGCRAPYPLG